MNRLRHVLDLELEPELRGCDTLSFCQHCKSNLRSSPWSLIELSDCLMGASVRGGLGASDALQHPKENSTCVFCLQLSP